MRILNMEVLLYLFILFVALFLLAPIWRGALFLPTHRATVETMIALLEIHQGMKTADLGSGDGRIVIAMAKAGAEARGYEVSPLLVWLSRRAIKKERLSESAFIHWESFWQCDFSQYDAVFVFGIGYIMKDLEKKLRNELKPGARVVSHAFPFPSWPLARKEGAVYLYIR
ncbi:MAG: hypothetical protein HYW78_03105 [Parcubacteria group bacterium]|nr:hypothetical protein [Parcubacteria group bacterium]